MTATDKLELGSAFVPFQTFPENNFLPVLDFLLSRQIITHTEKEILRILNGYLHKGEKGCYPKRETIAKKAGLSPKYVSRVLSALEEKGLLKIDRPSLVEKRVFRKNNRYHFLWTVFYDFYLNENSQRKPAETGSSPVCSPDSSPDAIINKSPIPNIPKKPVPVLSANGQGEVSPGMQNNPGYRKQIVTLSAEAQKQAETTGKRFNAGAFVGHALKGGIHPQAICEALTALIKAMPIIDSPFGYANRILSIRSGNHHERDMQRAADAMKNEDIPAGFMNLIQGIGGA